MTIGTAAVRERARGIIMTAGAYPEITRERHEPLTECLEIVPIGAGDAWLCQREGVLDGRLIVWDAASGERLAIAHPHRERVAALAFAANDGLLWSGSWDGQVVLMTTPR